MNKTSNFLTLVFSLSISWVFAQDTITVQTFDWPSESRDSVFQFPDPSEGPFRKIIMEYGMRCHDLLVGNLDVGCREWDYSCNTIIYDSSRVDSSLVDDGQGGLIYQISSPVRYEIMSFVTPYGNGLDLGPDGVTWYFDVTDFAPILNGKKRIALIGGGQFQEEMRITFRFIKGNPEREVIDIRPIWPLSLGTNVNHIAANRVYEPRTVVVPNGVADVKLRSIVTGHGQNGEFNAYNHELRVDDEIYKYRVWTECSTVPVFPQGGTWLLDRAGWCPGDPSTIHEFWVPEEKITSGQFVVDYDIPGIAGLAEARYIINNQMVLYGPVNRTNDASIEAVLRPSDRVEFARFNPSCFQPQFIIQNRGTEDLTQVAFTYGLEGGNQYSGEWQGNLAYGETDTITVEMPGSDYPRGSGRRVFAVQLTSADDEMDNNTYRQSFDAVPVFDSESMQILLTTNKRGNETELFLVNDQNDTIFQQNDLQGSRSYFNEISLMKGCYKLRVNDSNDDGLYFWFYERGNPPTGPGRGALQLFVNDEEVADFEPEFGRFFEYEFLVGNRTSNRDHSFGQMKVYPNPTQGVLTIECENYPFESDFVIVDALGRTLKKINVSPGSEILQWDVSDLSEGSYILQWTRENRVNSTMIQIVD